MNASTGERLRPLPARDRRGRFVAASDGTVTVTYQGPFSLEVLLWHFDLKGWCRFPDPWRLNGWYVIETRESLKHFPVAMRYEGPLLKTGGGLNGVIKYDMSDFGGRWSHLPNGEVAVSPMPHFGDPREGWGEGSWELGTAKRQLAALYIHLAHSVDLHTKSCGNKIGVTKGY